MGLLEGGGSWRFHFQCYFVLFCAPFLFLLSIFGCVMVFVVGDANCGNDGGCVDDGSVDSLLGGYGNFIKYRF